MNKNTEPDGGLPKWEIVPWVTEHADPFLIRHKDFLFSAVGKVATVEDGRRICEAHNAVIDRMVKRFQEKAYSQTELKALLIDVHVLLTGWHSDGTAWSEWDETVRSRVHAMQMKLEGAK